MKSIPNAGDARQSKSNGPKLSDLPTNQAGHRAKLASSADVRAKLSVECSICGRVAHVYSVTAAAFARDLYRRGWRYELSRKFALLGPMCRACATTPDERRGE